MSQQVICEGIQMKLGAYNVMDTKRFTSDLHCKLTQVNPQYNILWLEETISAVNKGSNSK